MNRTFYSVSMTMHAVLRFLFQIRILKYIYWSVWFCNLTVDGENIKRFYMNKNSNDTKMKDENLV